MTKQFPISRSTRIILWTESTTNVNVYWMLKQLFILIRAIQSPNKGTKLSACFYCLKENRQHNKSSPQCFSHREYHLKMSLLHAENSNIYTYIYTHISRYKQEPEKFKIKKILEKEEKAARQPTYWDYFKVVLQGQIYICQRLSFHSLQRKG